MKEIHTYLHMDIPKVCKDEQLSNKDVTLDKDFKRLIQAEIEEKIIPTLLGETFRGNEVKMK